MSTDRAARRRIASCAIAAAVIATSPGAGAQRAETVAHLGWLCGVRCEGPAYDALRDGLRSAGWAEGRNLKIDYRAAGGQLARLPALAQELVELKPQVLVVSAPQPSLALKNATSTIPIVFIGVADPVRVGLVESLAHPGGNLTGVATLVPGGFIGKQLEVLKQALPSATRIAALLNPTNDVTRALFPLEGPAAAQQLGVQLHVLEVSTPEGIEGAIDAAVRDKADALWVLADPIFNTPPQRIPDLAARAKLPALYLLGEQVAAGGLISYGPDFNALFRSAAPYIDRILKGANPRDLPVAQPTKFLMLVNLKTAKALGITMPPALLSRADEVIQ